MKTSEYSLPERLSDRISPSVRSSMSSRADLRRSAIVSGFCWSTSIQSEFSSAAVAPSDL
jgi:hypothetical protein